MYQIAGMMITYFVISSAFKLPEGDCECYVTGAVSVIYIYLYIADCWHDDGVFCDITGDQITTRRL